MKIITFNEEDQHEEWLKWRKNGITATDISVIMGSNEYTTPLKLWEKKCGYRDEDPLNVAMEHGMRSEPLAREWLNSQLQLNLAPLCVEDNKDSVFRASLDGWDDNQKVLCEIKSPLNEKTIDRARMQNAIPSHWFDQVLWQMMISQPQRAILAVWDYRAEYCHIVELCADYKRIEEMRKDARKFWHLIQSGKAPEMKKGDFEVNEDPRFVPLFEEYDELSDAERSIKERKEEIKKELLDLANGKNIETCGYKIYKTEPRKSYNYEQMKVDGIDLDPYTKIGKSSYVIKKTK